MCLLIIFNAHFVYFEISQMKTNNSAATQDHLPNSESSISKDKVKKNTSDVVETNNNENSQDRFVQINHPMIFIYIF